MTRDAARLNGHPLDASPVVADPAPLEKDPSLRVRLIALLRLERGIDRISRQITNAAHIIDEYAPVSAGPLPAALGTVNAVPVAYEALSGAGFVALPPSSGITGFDATLTEADTSTITFVISNFSGTESSGVEYVLAAGETSLSVRFPVPLWWGGTSTGVRVSISAPAVATVDLVVYGTSQAQSGNPATQAGAKLTVAPTVMSPVLARCVLVTGPPSAPFLLTLGTRVLPLFTDAKGMCLLSPVAFRLDYSDERSVLAGVTGSWTLEVSGYEDDRI